MSRRNTSRRLSAGHHQELEVAAALAREAVIQLHVTHALRLIRHAAGRVTPLRMLDIYIRLLDLSGTVQDVVANRVLAELGAAQNPAPRTSAADDADEAAEDANEADATDDRSLLRMLRRRLRGRVHQELRRTVQLETGVVQTALLDLHTRHAHGFVRLLRDSHGIDEACAVYTVMVSMPAALAAVLYMTVLNRIAAEEGRMWPAADTAAEQSLRAPALPARTASRSRARSSA